MNVSSPPDPAQWAPEDGTMEDQPTRRKSSSAAPWPMFDGLMKIYALLSFTMFVAIVFARLQDAFKKDFKPAEDCASVLIYTAYLFYFITVSIIFILYVLVFTCYQQITMRKAGKWESKSMVVENDKSFAPAIVRQAAVVFGLCYIALLIIELIAKWNHYCACWARRNFVINFVNIIFVVLQASLIVYYPRLNLHINRYLDRFGCMHLMVTNLILNLHVVVVESIVEVYHALTYENGTYTVKQAHWDEKAFISVEKPNGTFPQFGADRFPSLLVGNTSEQLDVISEVKYHGIGCDNPGSDIFDVKYISAITLYLYPFGVELVGIGALFFYDMYNNVGRIPLSKPRELLHKIHSPNPEKFFSRRDYGHTLTGLPLGLICLLGALVSLIVFHTYPNTEMADKEFKAIFTKVVLLLFSIIGIIAALSGLFQIKKIARKPRTTRLFEAEMEKDDSYDINLLRFTGSFGFVYLAFTFLAGLDHATSGRVSLGLLQVNEGWVSIVMGTLGLIEISVIITFLAELKRKNVASEHVTVTGRGLYPGRNMLVFLSVFNFSVWSVLTFQSQNYYSTAIGAKAFGNITYVVLQRFLLPLAIYFRFHAAVFSLILWKDYSHKDKTMSTREKIPLQ